MAVLRRAVPCYGASRCRCSGGAVPVRGGFLPLGVGVRRNGGAGGGSSCARPGAAGTRRGAGSGQRGTGPERTRVSAAEPGRGPPLTAPEAAGAAREMRGAGGGEGAMEPPGPPVPLSGGGHSAVVPGQSRCRPAVPHATATSVAAAL